MKINNPIRTYEVEIEGKAETVRLALNYYALTMLADLLQIDFAELDKAMSNLTIDKFPALVTAAMRGVNPETTEEQVKRFIAAIPVMEIPAVMGDLVASTNTPAGEGGQSHPQKAAATKPSR